MNRGAHGDSSLMLSTLVLSNENRQLADRREEAPTSSGGGGCHASLCCASVGRMVKCNCAVTRELLTKGYLDEKNEKTKCSKCY